MKNNTLIKLKTFNGTQQPESDVLENENYWKLIGETGSVIDCTENYDGRVLVLFDKELDELGLENHNPVKNALWIKKMDLETIVK